MTIVGCSGLRGKAVVEEEKKCGSQLRGGRRREAEGTEGTDSTYLDEKAGEGRRGEWTAHVQRRHAAVENGRQMTAGSAGQGGSFVVMAVSIFWALDCSEGRTA